MNIEVNNQENGLVEILLNGRLDIAGTGAIENTFTYQTATKKAAVLVDMSAVDFIASIGMRLLLSNARAVEGRGGKLGLLNPIDVVKEALVTAGIDKLIPIYTDHETASQELLAAL